MTSETTTAGALPVEQKSTIGQFIWIGFYSSILMLFTLTLFRFWARTQMRRRLWADTVIDGEPLDYVGKGSELFIGFLIAIATVGLPTVAFVLGAQFLIGEPIVLALVLLAFYLFFFLLIGAAIFLARRYQLSRTLWRGVRFQQDGSALGFSLAAFGYGLLTVLTLGWFAPVMRLRLARRMWGAVKFGDMPFEYDNGPAARTEPVWASFALAWFGALIYYIIVFGGMYGLGFFNIEAGPPGLREIGLLYALLFGALIPYILMVAWHEAVMLRQITKSISVAGVSLRSRLTTWDIVELVITNTLLVIFTLGFGMMAAQMRVWRRIVRKIEAEGALDYAAINQAASRGPKSGEGIADAFDLSGGV